MWFQATNRSEPAGLNLPGRIKLQGDDKSLKPGVLSVGSRGDSLPSFWNGFAKTESFFRQKFNSSQLKVAVVTGIGLI